jgi:hypothetical protein
MHVFGFSTSLWEGWGGHFVPAVVSKPRTYCRMCRGGIFTIFTVSQINNSSMDVDFYVELTAPSVDIEEQQAYLENFLQRVEGALANVLHGFVVVFYASPLAPEPPLLPSYTLEEAGVVCTVQFQFQYLNLRHTHFRIRLLECLIDNFCLDKGVVPY